MIRRNLLFRVKFQSWLWINFKLAMLVWSFLLYHFTPLPVQQLQGLLVTAGFTIVTGIGAIVSVSGLLIRNQSIEVDLIGTEIELGGLFFMLAGPLAYLLTQIVLAFSLPDGDQRYALCALSYALCSAMACRIAIVFSHMLEFTHESKVLV